NRPLLNELIKKWYRNNPQKRREMQKRQREKYPERFKARAYAKNHKLKDDNCSKCGITENLHFHHTNYKKNEGITLCKDCHNKQHFKLIT
ncbi:MAG: hypothetical protein AABY22_21720, partial [Nanoarchaeota archaeon]